MAKDVPPPDEGAGAYAEGAGAVLSPPDRLNEAKSEVCLPGAAGFRFGDEKGELL